MQVDVPCAGNDDQFHWVSEDHVVTHLARGALVRVLEDLSDAQAATRRHDGAHQDAPLRRR